MSEQALLSVQDLRVEYFTDKGSVCVVDGVSFDIGRGEILGLAGESGCGKSTIAQAILRILQPPAVITGGRVLFEGEDVLSMSPEQLRAFRWKKISLVFQSAMNALNPVMTIGEQIADVVRTHESITPAQALERAAEMLEVVGIGTGRLSSYPHELSGGMRQRVMIAIALVLRPPLVMMDEPTTALDVVVQKEILHQIVELKERFGFSVLFITHDLSLMFELSTRIAILYAGRLAEVAPARELLDDARHPYTRGLMESFPSLAGGQGKLKGIGGVPPDMRHPPEGCRFNPRCDRVEERCREIVPPLIELSPARRAACHLS